MKETFSNDDELFRAIMNNDEQAIKKYHDDIYPALRGFANKRVKDLEAATDIATDAFCDTLNSGYNFTDLKGITWYLYNNARYKCQDHKKRKAPANDSPLNDDEVLDADALQFENDVIWSEFRMIAYEQIKALPRKIDRDILIQALKGFKPVEIAKQLGTYDEYVRTRIKDLAKQIRNELIDKKIISVLILLLSQISSL
jgi:RNA polymerase sigma factor (sigma-70 family)